jgi:hypothetical protein
MEKRMSKYPVTVILTTYDAGDGSRTEIATQVICSLKENMVYPNLKYIISDDGSPQKHRDTLQKELPEATMINVERRGIGVSKNTALKEAFKTGEIVLLMEDDWKLVESPFYLEPFVQMFLDYDDIGCIRFGFLGGNMIATYTDYGDFRTYWHLHKGSGFYVYSGQVSLRTKRFYDAVGYHAEGLTPGQEEEDMCKRFNATNNAPRILWPAMYATLLNKGPFVNIGMGHSLNSIEVGS